MAAFCPRAEAGVWQHRGMTRTADLSSRIIKATAKIRRPAGIAATQRVVLGDDASNTAAAWIDFGVDDSKADARHLLRFLLRVEHAAAKVASPLAIHVRFSPMASHAETLAGRAPSSATKPATTA